LQVAKAIVACLRKCITFRVVQESHAILADLHNNDFFSLAQSPLIKALLRITLTERSDVHDAITAYCFAECIQRKLPLDEDLIDKCASLYKNQFHFESYRLDRGWINILFDDQTRSLSVAKPSPQRDFQQQE
jgi:hypothetical protein